MYLFSFELSWLAGGGLGDGKSDFNENPVVSLDFDLNALTF